MAIAFGRKAHNGWGTAAGTTPVTVTIVVNAGETVIIDINQTWDASAAQSGSTFNAGSFSGGGAYTQSAGPATQTAGNTNRRSEQWATAAGTATAAVSIVVTPATVSGETLEITARCYTGVLAIGASATATNTTANPSIALVTQDANNYVAAAFTCDGAVTALTGSLRDTASQTGVNAPNLDTGITDNTAASASSVTNAVTVSANGWAACATELRLTGPVISAQPTNQTVVEGATGAFTITASGTGTLHYQWKVNGSNVGADQNSYTTPATTMADHLSIVQCVITDDIGTTSSSTVYLLIVPTASVWPYQA